MVGVTAISLRLPPPGFELDPSKYKMVGMNYVNHIKLLKSKNIINRLYYCNLPLESIGTFAFGLQLNL